MSIAICFAAGVFGVLFHEGLLGGFLLLYQKAFAVAKAFEVFFDKLGLLHIL